ncbi:MAG: hypothetical protein ACM3JJ_00845 [Hyphomicrobiales bacterium]
MSRDPRSARATRGPVTVWLDPASPRVPRGGTVDVAIGIALAPGWTIGSVAGDPRGGLEATVVQLGAAEGLRPGPLRAPEGSVNPLGGERLRVYAGAVVIAVTFDAAKDALLGPAPIAARVRFQASEEGRTHPADTIEVASEVEIVASSEGEASQARSTETSS